MARANGRPVYANYHIAGINCPKIIRGARPDQYVEKFGKNHYYLENPERLIRMTRANMFPRNSLVVLDEAYAWGLDARETMTGAMESRKSRLALTHAILQSRKAHFNIEHTEQLIKSIDNRLRFLTEIYVLMEGISYRYIDGEKINVEFKLSPFQNLGVWGFRQLPSLFIKEPIFWALNSCYDTYEQITLEQEAIEQAENANIKHSKIEPAIQETDNETTAENFTI